MDPNDRAEVTVVEPTSKIPAVNAVKASPTKILSTIPKRKDGRHENWKGQPGKLPFSFEKPNRPLDIDLLLRLYACNSSMEKSIRRVITEADRNRGWLSRSLIPKDAPRIELTAACKIFGNSHCREVVNALEYLRERCSDEVLLHQLACDSSLKICKLCGVVGYSKPSGIPEPSFSSRNARFLHPADASSDTAARPSLIMHRSQGEYNAEKKNIGFHPDMEELFGGMKNCSGFRSSKGIVKQHGEYDYHTLRRSGIMAAERESEITLKEQKAGINDQANNAKTTCASLATERKFNLKRIGEGTEFANETSSRVKHSITGWRNETTFCRAKYYNEEAAKGFKPDSNLPERRFNEDYGKEIWSAPRPEFRDARVPNLAPQGVARSSKRTQQSLIKRNNAGSTGNPVEYLARSAIVNGREKESVSQLSERACVPSNFGKKSRGFALHGPRRSGLQLDAGFWLNDVTAREERESRDRPGAGLRKDRFPLWNRRYSLSDSTESLGSESRTCSMENDSLEDCRAATEPQPGESDTTGFSSSSAENMIREWMRKPAWKHGGNCGDDAILSRERSVNKYRAETKIAEVRGTNVDCTLATEPRGVNIDGVSDACRSLAAKPAEVLRVSNGRTWLGNLRENSGPSDRQESIRVAPENSSEGNSSGFCDHTFRSGKSAICENVIDDARKERSALNECPDALIKAGRHSSDENLGFGDGYTPAGNVKLGKINFHSGSNGAIVKSSKTAENRKILSRDRFRDFARRISYSEVPSKDVTATEDRYARMAEMLSLYREVLEQSEGMDWEEFQQLVGNLHPAQKDLWLDICRVVNAAASRAADKVAGMEVCIEISPVLKRKRAEGAKACNNEIVFEMDMSLRDLERILGRRGPPTKRPQLDTHQKLDGNIKVRNGDVWDTRVNSNKPE